MRIDRTAYGAGTREYKDFPNALRLILGEMSEPPASAGGLNAAKNRPQINTDEYGLETNNQQPTTNNQTDQTLFQIETNIDDLSPQNLGFVMERAFDLGAFDCWFTPIQMKKNRPATMISILCEVEKREILTELLYTETSTLGVRIKEVERNCLPRETVQIENGFGTVDVKISKYKDKIVNAKPEYEQIREIALKSNKSLREVEREVLEKLNNGERFKIYDGKTIRNR